MASCGGHGTIEALQLSRTLEEADIPCCFCGVSALIYYGAGRVRDHWEVCIPTELMKKAEALLKSDSCADIYLSIPLNPIPQPQSLAHTYPWFKAVGLDFYFVLVPSHDVHFECEPSNIQRSHRGLPFPKLNVLLQSFLETTNRVGLRDTVDGTDISEQWGVENLDLEGTNDLPLAAVMNKAITESCPHLIMFGVIPSQELSKRELWESIVRNKDSRRGWTQPGGFFSTRFRLHGSPDPWLEPRESC
ncbi:hypothetical protein ACJZ2D_006486 [Fusarium nematophilum]